MLKRSAMTFIGPREPHYLGSQENVLGQPDFLQSLVDR